MIAIDCCAVAGPPPIGGIGEMTRRQVEALLRMDPETRYLLCYRYSRWRKGNTLRPTAANAQLRLMQDPLNGLLLAGARVFYSPAQRLPRTPRIPKIVTIQDINHVRNPETQSPERLDHNLQRLRRALERADCIIAPSEFTAKELVELCGVAESRIRVVGHGVDARQFERLPPDDPAVRAARARYGRFALAIGLLVPRKNFTRLVEAVSRVGDLGLVLVGRRGRDAEAVYATIDRLGMVERVTHLESVPFSELRALLSAAQVFAVPSLYEGYGLVLAEALAAGVPVVSSAAGSLPEVAGGAALLVDALDVDALADGLRRASSDEALRKQLIESGLRRAGELSWEASARGIRDVCRELAGI